MYRALSMRSSSRSPLPIAGKGQGEDRDFADLEITRHCPHLATASGRGGSSRLFAGAELSRCLRRQEALAEAERGDQCQVLGAADEGFELLVEGLEQIRVLLAEAEA